MLESETLHLGTRLAALLRGRSEEAAPKERSSATEAVVVFVFVLLLIQSYWVFVLANYVGLLEAGGHTAIVVAGPERP